MTSTILLSHLQTSNNRIPLPTLQSVLSHQLSNAPSTSASPATLTVTQLTATAISSPFFLPRSHAFEHAKLQAFEVASRHAVHLLRQQHPSADHVNLSRWTGGVVRGIQGGHPLLRLAACGGILLGVEDLKHSADVNANALVKLSRKAVESEAVVALAEVLDSTTVHTEWEDEFQHQGRPRRHQKQQHPSSQRPARNTLLLAFILASHSLPLVDSQRLVALPLHTLARLLTSTLVSFFDSPDPGPKDTSTDISHVPSLAKLTSVILSALLDSTHTRTHTRTLTTLSDIFNTLFHLSRTIEQTHPTIDPSDPIPKQFLFTAITVFQSVLSSIIYLRPHNNVAHPGMSLTPPALALIALQTLTHLSLVISQFGGITKAFEQLQKVFYLSIDIILSSGRHQDQNQTGQEDGCDDVEAYVQRLSHFLQSQSPETATTLPFRAKLSFALSTFEQLVPILSPHCIINHIWNVCYPCLTNPSESNREIYESAHSVILSMLVHDPHQRQEPNPTSPLLDSTKTDNEERTLWTNFTQRLVPFYAKCLVEDTTLTIPQLSHAYSSLVQCASSLSAHALANPTSTTGLATALPWYCVQLISDTIDELSSSSSSSDEAGPRLPAPPPPSKPQQPPLSRKDRVHRLHLMLVSTLPSLPLGMLERCLEGVRGVLIGYSDSAAGVGVKEDERDKEEERGKQLVEMLFELLLSERMGQGGKEVGVKWWYDNLGLIRAVGGGEDKEVVEVLLQSRL